MKHIKEFSRQADSYTQTNIVQKKVATHLISKVKNSPKKILDLGCGAGDIYNKIDWKLDKFIGVDSAKGMCNLHPKDNIVSILNNNFEDLNFQKKMISEAPFDLVISSSALQWATDIESLIAFSSTLSKNIAFSIFTSGTFEDIYKISGLESFLPNANELIKTTKKYLDIEYELKIYRLEFEDNISKFRYIKKSGVSGGEKKLTLIQTKNLIKNYPHSYLEFEVLYLYK